MNVVARAAVAAAVALGTTAAGYALAGPVPEPALEALGPEPVTVVVKIAHSRFEPPNLRVVAGTQVRFVVVNTDPINHELIIGPPEVHDRHRSGTEAAHVPVPGEVSVPALERAVTTYRFDEVGTVQMACHLPGHYDHGMHGQIEVVAAAPPA